MATKKEQTIKQVKAEKPVKDSGQIIPKAKAKKLDEAGMIVEAPKVAKGNRIAWSKTPRNDVALSVTVYSLLGKEAGSLELPKEIFEGKVNKALLSQAIRVYTNNEKGHYSNTKTRGEVAGSTRKIYKQKGTGRARHGSIMAPIFVGGGIALGPKVRKTIMELPKKMKKAALIAALRARLNEKELLGLEADQLSGKTREFGTFLKGVQKKTALIVVGAPNELMERATRNIRGINQTTATGVNVFDVIRYQSVFLTQDAVEKLQERLMKGDKTEQSVSAKD